MSEDNNTKEALYGINLLEKYNKTNNNEVWQKKYNKDKKDYINKILNSYGYLPASIGFWRLSKIKERFPLKK